ncbi:MAG TPA: DUF1801 domain-containing protein [Terrimesophilobacter sp.]|nr:DUF1801 domain-containing protein [Terrimesophilobacter sp.]
MSAARRNDVTTRPTTVPVEEFLATVTKERRLADARKIIAIMRRVTGVEPVMSGASVIGFGSYHYRYATGHEGDTPVVGLSPRSAAMSVYGLYNAYDPDPRFEKLGPHKVGKSCLYITRFDAVDQDLFETFVREAWDRQGSPC